MPGLYDMVRDALAEAGLDPDVRVLAVEALEARLVAKARALLGDAGAPSATLRDDGTVRLAWRVAGGVASLELPEGAGQNVDAPTRAALAAAVQRELITQLAPSLGAARLAVKNGVSVTRAEAPRPEAAGDPVVDALRALAELVALQEERLDALAKALGDAGIAVPEVGIERGARLRALRAAVDALSRR